MQNAPPKMTAATRIRRNQSIPTGRVDDELMALDPRAGEVYGLDPVATLVWDRVGDGIEIGALVDGLVADHDVTREQCLADVLDFLEQCRAAGLVIVEA